MDNLFLFRLRDCDPFPLHHRSAPHRGIVRADGAICPPVGLNFQRLGMGNLTTSDYGFAVENFAAHQTLMHCLNLPFRCQFAWSMVFPQSVHNLHPVGESGDGWMYSVVHNACIIILS